MKGRMTLFVDASFHPQSGAGGWGSWAIRDEWPQGVFQGGPIRFKAHEIDNSNTAELAGIALALWSHNQQGHLVDLDEVMIQCDNVAALSCIHKRVPRTRIVTQRGIFIGKTSWNNPVVPIILDTIKSTLASTRVALKHVKGHSDPRKDGRSWVNMQCDREARKHMSAMRKELSVVT